jgi:hypothetical protein
MACARRLISSGETLGARNAGAGVRSFPASDPDDGKDIAMFIEQWWRTVYGASEIWAAARRVIALRSARVLADGFAPRADTRRELAHGAEKTAAAGESATAIVLQMWRTNWELALTPMRLWWSMWAGAARSSPFRPVPAASRQLVAAASKIVPAASRRCGAG